MNQNNKLLILGALENCDLPELGLTNIQMRVDTGAATSALHVDNIRVFAEDNKRYVTFDIHPDVHNVEVTITKTLRLKGRKVVKSTSAKREKRVVIKTPIHIAGQEWPIKLTLTDRSSMKNLMLLGREAMLDRILVNPSEEFLISHSMDDSAINN